jgi:RimJ/RimL family protein N-acetyltransferase
LNEAEFGFRPVTEDDIPLLHAWLNNPAVAEWYGLDLENKTYPALEDIARNYRPRIRGEVKTYGYIMQVDGADVGYIQCYRIGDHPEYAALLAYDDDAWGIDLFIGEDRVRGRGLAAPLLRRFVEREVLTRPECSAVVIAPNPENARAIHVYERVGFRHLKTVWIPQEGEHEYVMVLRTSG